MCRTPRVVVRLVAPVVCIPVVVIVPPIIIVVIIIGIVIPSWVPAVIAVPVPGIPGVETVRIVVGIVICRVYIYCVTVVVYIPVTQPAVVHQVPENITEEPLSWGVETDDACRIGVVIDNIVEVVGVIAVTVIGDVYILDTVFYYHVVVTYKIDILGALYHKHRLLLLRYIVEVIDLCPRENRINQHQ